MTDSTDGNTEDLSAAVSAALDDLLGPDPVEIVEEQEPDSGLPDASGTSEEHYRTFPARYGG